VLTVAGHGIGSHGDDRSVLAGRLDGSNGARGLESIHNGHLAVHENEIETPAAEGVKGLFSISGDGHRGAEFLEDLFGEALVNEVILDDEDPEAGGNDGRSGRSRGGGARLRELAGKGLPAMEGLFVADAAGPAATPAMSTTDPSAANPSATWRARGMLPT